MSTILQKANAILGEVTAIRRDIHAHPELGGQEFRTSELIRKKLQEYGIDEIDSPTPTSVIALIRGRKGPGRCVALRSDIDALPVTEKTGLPFASENPGVMHACGHDMHCAMMLGNAKILCGMRDDFAGTVKLIFQHSEEMFPGGSRELVKLGVMEGVDAVFGMHVFPTENDKCGVVGTRPGAFTTSTDNYYFDIIGTGGHGSLPHKAPDPILAAAEMIMMFQQIQSRAVAPLDAAIFMMNKIEGGTAPNIISEEVHMCGNARSYTNEARKTIDDYARKIAESVEMVSGCKINVDPHYGYDACFNDPELYGKLMPVMESALGKEHVETFAEPMGFSEDYSFYSTLTGVPSLFLILQAGSTGPVASLHNAQCSMREEAMPYGMAAMMSCALELLK